MVNVRPIIIVALSHENLFYHKIKDFHEILTLTLQIWRYTVSSQYRKAGNF